jgi:Tol biopolymer transport system component
LALHPGTKLGAYEVFSQIGAGGMGEVYRARDAKLNRDVALKVLPTAVAQDPERMGRFQREAQVLASLNHSNIAGIYGLEESASSKFLVLELVEGEDLSQRLSRGPLPLDEAVAIARQIAVGLEAAHEQGIVHRDLKPANLKVRKDGTAKILDFGLAKACEAGPAANASEGLTHSPTLSQNMTAAGIILGTASYMSPEQARGKPVDKRADIWAFGVVFMEMLTGAPMFSGETVTDTLASVVRAEPDWTALPAETPATIRRLLKRTLEKDPRRRLRDIGEAVIQLESLAAEEEPVPVVARSIPGRKRFIPWAIALILAIVSGILGWRELRAPAKAPSQAVRLSLTVPQGYRFAGSDWPLMSLSEDGALMTLMASRGGESELLLRRMDQPEVTAIPGTKGAIGGFFSPDGKWLCFSADRKLKKVSLEGGSPTILADCDFAGGSWGEDGTIVYTPNYAGGLWRVAVSGGKPEMLTTADSSKGELGHFWPQILPGGKAALLTSFSTPVDRARIEILDLSSKKRTTVLEGGLFARYLPTGHLLYARGESLMAVRFDLSSLSVKGSPVQVQADVAGFISNGFLQYAVSDNGTLAYFPAAALNFNKMLGWADRKGNWTRITDDLKQYEYPSISPDGRRLAVAIRERGDKEDIWIYEFERGTMSRLTFSSTRSFNPIWTPDSKQIFFDAESPVYEIHSKHADTTGSETVILTGPYDRYPDSFSPDGKVLAYRESNPKTGSDLWLLPLEGDRKPVVFLQTPHNEDLASFSPDGRWLAYQSDESGRFEAYAQSYGGAAFKVQVSTNGGRRPVWSRDGKELFYREGTKMMAVSVASRPESLAVGKPVLLFDDHDQSSMVSNLDSSTTFDVNPDGRRFLVMRPDPNPAPIQMQVVLNWFEELKRRVP